MDTDIAIMVGFYGGAFFAYWLSKSVALSLSKRATVPRLVLVCSAVGAILMLPQSLYISFIVGGNFGGAIGSLVSENIRLGSVGAPVGIAVGIAIFFGGCLTVGASVGSVIGRLLSRAKPRA